MRSVAYMIQYIRTRTLQSSKLWGMRDLTVVFWLVEICALFLCLEHCAEEAVHVAAACEGHCHVFVCLCVCLCDAWMQAYAWICTAQRRLCTLLQRVRAIAMCVCV